MELFASIISTFIAPIVTQPSQLYTLNGRAFSDMIFDYESSSE